MIKRLKALAARLKALKVSRRSRSVGVARATNNNEGKASAPANDNRDDGDEIIFSRPPSLPPRGSPEDVSTALDNAGISTQPGCAANPARKRAISADTIGVYRDATESGAIVVSPPIPNRIGGGAERGAGPSLVPAALQSQSEIYNAPGPLDSAAQLGSTASDGGDGGTEIPVTGSQPRPRSSLEAILDSAASSMTSSFGDFPIQRATFPDLGAANIWEQPPSDAPIRPPRPESPGLWGVVVQANAPAESWPSRSPFASAEPPLNEANLTTPSTVTRSGPNHPQNHIRDGTWLVPVAVLTPAVYTFEYQFAGTIGEGGFGKVMLALHLRTHAQYAIKVIALRRVRSRREAASIAGEVKVLWRVWKKGREEAPFLSRPAAVKEWVWQYRGNVHLVLEYYQGGDLGRGAVRHTELRDPHRFKLMVAEVIIAILALHNMGIIHHDVKPTNILVDAEGHCILADYGGSCFLSEGSMAGDNLSPDPVLHGFGSATVKDDRWLRDQIPIFTIQYAAPEVLLNGATGRGYGTAIDFWSLGITLFELATGRDLIDEPDDDAAVFAIQQGEIDLTQLFLLSMHPGLRQFVSALLVAEPAQRLQGHDAKSHEYFSEFTQSDWTAIFTKQRPPFHPNKQHPVNPRNTSYDYVERPGEGLLDDGNEDIVCRWLAEDGVGLPHHRDSVYQQQHKGKARMGLPERAKRMAEEAWAAVGGLVGPTSV